MLIIRTLICSLLVLALTVSASEARVKKKRKPVDEDTAQATAAAGTVYGGNLPNSGNPSTRGASLSSTGNTTNSQQVIVPNKAPTGAAAGQKNGDKSSGSSTQSHGKH